MTYQSDPTRWTQSHGDAPELLRSAFDAGSREGPSALQMRTLALKLAAVGGGAAIAAGASTAHASATAGGGALATAGSGSALTLGKLAVSIALIGAAATGTVLWQRDAGSTHARSTQAGATARATAHQTMEHVSPQLAEPALAPQPTPTVSTLPGSARAADKGSAVHAAPSAQPSLGQAPSPSTTDRAVVNADNRAVAEPRPAHSSRRSHAGRSSSTTVSSSSPNAARSGESVAVERVEGQRQQLSEIDLLRGARAALAASPREAYRLTEEHRTLYPQGVFTQERDALAVEALVRAGDLKLARELAEVFVRRYPSSPHAHRFRESMKLP